MSPDRQPPDPQVAVIGAGLVGRRVAQALADDNIAVLLRSHRRPAPVLSGVGVETAAGSAGALPASVEVVVLATESRDQAALARQMISEGRHVVATADGPTQVERLWQLGQRAHENGVGICVGAAYSPGVSTVLVAALIRSFDHVSSIRTAQFGTGGPACAREHHRAMNSPALEVYDGALRRTLPGTGRHLVWFPEPAGAADCYRAGLAEPFVLHHTFPTVERIESRQAATRRDRLTARLPMLRRPHAEGLIGSVWAEVRGLRDGVVEHRVLAATAPQATAAAAMAAVAARQMLKNKASTGAFSTGNFDNPVSMLREMCPILVLWTYDGQSITTHPHISTTISAAKKWPRSPKNGPIRPISGPDA